MEEPLRENVESFLRSSQSRGLPVLELLYDVGLSTHDEQVVTLRLQQGQPSEALRELVRRCRSKQRLAQLASLLRRAGYTHLASKLDLPSSARPAPRHAPRYEQHAVVRMGEPDPESPHTSPASPHTATSPVSPHTATSPASPHTATSPASPHTATSPALAGSKCKCTCTCRSTASGNLRNNSNTASQKSLYYFKRNDLGTFNLECWSTAFDKEAVWKTNKLTQNCTVF